MKNKRAYLYGLIAIFTFCFMTCYAYSEEAIQKTEPAVTEMQVAPATGEAASQAAEPTVKVEATDVVAPNETAAPAAQEAPTASAEPAKAVEAQKSPETKPTAEELKEIKWVWGEVASVDAANNKIIIKYLNYDTDAEETLTVLVDAATRFENAEGINAVKAGDNIGVDYSLSASAEAVAKSIALEKAEPMPEASAEEKAETSIPAPQEAVQLNAAETPAQK